MSGANGRMEHMEKKMLVVAETRGQVETFCERFAWALDGVRVTPHLVSWDPNRLRGPQFHTTMLLVEPDDETWMNVRVATRLGDDPRVVRLTV